MKLIKTLLLTGCAAPAIVVPMTTMTSCSQSWGSARPLSIGSTLASGGPYSAFKPGIYDADGKDITKYLQSNYSVQPSGNNYAYSLPMKFVDDPEKKQEDVDQWQIGSSGWYTSGDSHLTPYATDKWKDDEGKTHKQVVTNAQNATLATNTNFVSSIGSAIKSFIELALQYTTTQLNKDKLEQTEEDLKVAWGGDMFDLKHGTIGDNQNREFFEFIFSLSNLVGADVAKALMKSSAVNFLFIPGLDNNRYMPLPSYKVDGSGNVTDFSDDFKLLLENKTDDAFDPSVADYYTSKTEVRKEKNPEKEDEPFHYIVYTYDCVPVIVQLNDLTTTYINPTNTDENGKSISSFIVSDYYSSKNQIMSTIGNSWKNSLPTFTDCEVTDAIPTKQSFTLKSQQRGSVLPSIHDERILISETNAFFVLLSYSVQVYVKETSKGSGVWVLDPGNQKKNKATMNKMQNLFPAVFADNNMYGSDLFKTWKASDESNEVHIFNEKVINKKLQSFINLLNRTSADGRKARASQVSDEGKKLLRFLGYLFGGVGEEIRTNVFLSSSDLPQD